MHWIDIYIGSAFIFDSHTYIKMSETEYFNPADGNIHNVSVFPVLDKFHKAINRLSVRAQIPERVKSVLYDADSYAIKTPDGPTAYWNRQDWIKYIDSSGYWIYQDLGEYRG